MRHENDRLLVRITLSSVIDLDLERVEEDPQWQRLIEGKDDSNKDIVKAMLFEYINQYLLRGPRIMTNAPSTNGPSELWPIEMEIISERPNTSIPDTSTCGVHV
jgi:hypothetical protein